MVKNWHEFDVKHVLSELKTTKSGLSDEEAKRRLSKYGPNEIALKRKRSITTLFLKQFKSILIIVLIVASVFSFLIGEHINSIFIIIIVVLNAIFGFVQEYKAEKSIEALKRLTAPETIVIRDGKERKVPVRSLVPGDVVVLEQGAKVPADMRLIQVFDMKIDESAITGESVPVKKDTKTVSTANLGERRNMAYMGTIVTYGRGIGVVVDTGMNTEMGNIALMIQQSDEEQTPLQKNLEIFGKRLGLLILTICGIIVFTGILHGFNFIDILIIGISLAVAAIPEGLPAIVTVTLALGIQKMSKQNAIVRRMSSVETLGSTTLICSDKTGTLTRNEMVVRKIWSSGEEYDVTGEGYLLNGDFYHKGRKINPKRLEHLLTLAYLCNNASISKINGKWETTGDPTELALKVVAMKSGIKPDMDRIKEIPFTSERKMMTTINKISPRKLMVCSKGAPETILKHCNRILIDGKVSLLTASKKNEILKKNQEFAGNALRVLGFAYKKISTSTKSGFEKDLIFIGLVGMFDSPREGVKNDILTCRKAGIKVVMITGDNENTATAVGREIGLIENHNDLSVITGEELNRMSSKELEKVIENISIFARVNPEHKLRIVEAFKSRGHVIAMTGDGVNDAPALKKADIGISMGITGTDVAKEASDMILKDDNFSTIVSAVREGRAIYDNIKKFVQYLLSSNLGEVLVIFTAMIIGFEDPLTGSFVLPLTAVQLLWINLLTDGLPAIALGVDPPEENIMMRPPRNPKEKILSRDTLSDIITTGILICIGTIFLFATSLPSGAAKAITVSFTAIVVFELVRIQSIRMRYNMKLFSNTKLVFALMVSFALQLIVVYTPFFQTIFGTVNLNPLDWVKIILAAGTIVFIMWVKTKIFTGND